MFNISEHVVKFLTRAMESSRIEGSAWEETFVKVKFKRIICVCVCVCVRERERERERALAQFWTNKLVEGISTARL